MAPLIGTYGYRSMIGLGSLPGLKLAANPSIAGNTKLFHAADAGLYGDASGFWFNGWFYLDRLPSEMGDTPNLIKNFADTSAGMNLYTHTVEDRIYWELLGAVSDVNMQGPAVVAATWSMFYADYTGTQARIGLNGGALTTAAYSDFVPDTTSLWWTANQMDGRVGPFCGAMGGATLSTEQQQWLFNGGNGRTTAEVAAGGLGATVGWDMDEESDGSGAVPRVDGIGSLDLSDDGTTESVAGLRA